MILGMQAWVFWLILTAVLVVIEACTVNLVSIWFAGGTLLALAASLLGASVTLQVIIAFAMSAVLLAAVVIFKPFDKLKSRKNLPTNYDRVLGQEGLVEAAIDNTEGTGQVKVMGQVWSAVSEAGEDIPAGCRVKVVAVSGVKLKVKKIKTEGIDNG